MLLSLSSCHGGFACAIKVSIINHSGPCETQFFDWVLCSMKTINTILSTDNEFIFDVGHRIPHPMFTVIPLLNFDYLQSVHDFSEITDSAIEEVTHKYKRRVLRLKNTITHENDITFIRFALDSDLCEEEIHTFYTILESINPNLDINFILVTTDCKLNISSRLANKKGFQIIYMREIPVTYEEKIKAYDRIFRELWPTKITHAV